MQFQLILWKYAFYRQCTLKFFIFFMFKHVLVPLMNEYDNNDNQAIFFFNLENMQFMQICGYSMHVVHIKSRLVEHLKAEMLTNTLIQLYSIQKICFVTQIIHKVFIRNTIYRVFYYVYIRNIVLPQKLTLFIIDYLQTLLFKNSLRMSSKPRPASMLARFSKRQSREFVIFGIEISGHPRTHHIR